MKLRSVLAGLTALATIMLNTPASRAEEAPAAITIGSLHASSGPFAAISMPVYYGLKYWVDQTNADGGVFVKAYNKKIPLKFISYDDQSNPATAATLTNQLITQDHVNLLVTDSGSVLTAVVVPIAHEHKQFLFDATGTGAPFFTKDNPYIALLADPASTIWPKFIADFLNADGPASRHQDGGAAVRDQRLHRDPGDGAAEIHHRGGQAEDRLRPGRADQHRRTTPC